MEPSERTTTKSGSRRRWLALSGALIASLIVSACSDAPPPLAVRVVMSESGQDVTDAAQIRLDRVVATQGDGAIRFRFVRTIERGADGRYNLAELSAEDQAALRLTARFATGARERLLTAAEIASGEATLRVDGALVVARIRRSEREDRAAMSLRASLRVELDAEAAAPIVAIPQTAEEGATSVAAMILPAGVIVLEARLGEVTLDALDLTLSAGAVEEVSLDGRSAETSLTVVVTPPWSDGSAERVLIALEPAQPVGDAAPRVIDGEAGAPIELGRLGAAAHVALATLAPDPRFEVWVEEEFALRLDDAELDAGAAALEVEIETAAVHATLLGANGAPLSSESAGGEVVWRVLDTPRGGPVSAAVADAAGAARMRFFPIDGERYVLAAAIDETYVAFAPLAEADTAFGALSETRVARGAGGEICLELFSENLCAGVVAEPG